MQPHGSRVQNILDHMKNFRVFSAILLNLGKCGIVVRGALPVSWLSQSTNTSSNWVTGRQHHE